MKAIKRIIRQWLCEHKNQRTLKKIETCEILANLTKEKAEWCNSKVLKFKVWNRCNDCGKIITYEVNL